MFAPDFNFIEQVQRRSLRIPQPTKSVATRGAHPGCFIRCRNGIPPPPLRGRRTKEASFVLCFQRPSKKGACVVQRTIRSHNDAEHPVCHLNEQTSARRGAGLRFWHLMKSPGRVFCTVNDYMGDGIRSERLCYNPAKRKSGASDAMKRNPATDRAHRIEVNCDF